MTFKTRLTITFLAVVFMPLILFGITVLCMSEYQRHVVSKNFGIDSDTYEIAVNSIQLFSSVTENIYEDIQEYIATDGGESLEDKTKLDTINDKLSKKSSFLVVRKGNDIFYTGNAEKTQEIKDVLPAYRSTKGSNYKGETYMKKLKLLIKQADFRFKDHSKGSVFIVTMTKDLIPQTRSLAFQVMLAFVVIMVLTGLALVSWMYTGLISPLEQITEATKKIREGNLDFEIDIPESKDEVAVLCKSFEEMRGRLKESADKQIESEHENRALITNITHDLKTPVTSIKGYAEGLLDGVAATPERQEKYLKTIYNKASDMDRLINELTFYAGIDTDRIPYNFAKLNIVNYFTDCIEELQVELESRSMTLSFKNELPDDTYVIADPMQFKKVINNIVGNAIKYTDKSDGNVAILLKDLENVVIIEIRDNGMGIAEKDLPYIFDRFYRADASRNSARGGSGIGLSIVRKIVEDHGGRVWATSEAGVGTTMNIELRKYVEQ